MNWGQFQDAFNALVQDGSVGPMIPDWFNSCQLEMLLATQWRHLDRRIVIPTTAPVTAGTVAVTNGQAVVVGTGTAFSASMVNQMFQAGSSQTSDGNYYVIASVTDATHLTLESPFIGTTAAASPYQISFYEQDPPAGFDPQRMYDVVLQVGRGAHRPLNYVTEGELFQVWANESIRFGVPEYFRLYRNRIHFFPIPSQVYNVQYFYAVKPALVDSTTARTFQPDWEDEHMQCLLDWVWERFLIWDKDTDWQKVSAMRKQKRDDLIRKNDITPGASIRMQRFDEGYYGGRLRPPRFPVTIG